MNNISQKYNRNLLLLFVFAPFIAYIFMAHLHMSYNRVLQLLSYIGVFLLLFFRSKKYPIKFPKYLLFYLLFILYIFFSTFVLLDRDFKVKYLFSFFPIGAFNVMFIIENIVISKKYYNSIIKISEYILIIAVLVIIIQQTINYNFFAYTDPTEENFRDESASSSVDRLHSIYSWLGSLSVGFSFIPIFILIVEELDKKKKKILIWIIMGILFAFLTKARWIMVNSLLVFFIVFINHRNKAIQFIKYLFLTPLIGVMFFFLLNFIGVDITGIVKDRILESDKKDIRNKSAGTRLLAFKAFEKFYWDNPVFGAGAIKYGMGGTGKQEYKLRNFLRGRSSQMHVGYLSLFYMYGLIGGFFFLSFLFLLLKKLYQNAKISGIWAPFLGFLGFALANLTLVDFSVFEMGFIIVLVADRYYSQYKKVSNSKKNKNQWISF